MERFSPTGPEAPPREGERPADPWTRPAEDGANGYGGVWGTPEEQAAGREAAQRRGALRPHEPPKSAWRRAGGSIVAFAVLIFSFFSKLKGVLVFLPKFATTGISMIVSIGAYALLFGLPFAVGFVLLLLVHEMGHVLQLRREGIKATAPLFIPFLGAVVGMKELPNDAAAEARVGLAGPVLGTVGVLAPVALFFATGEPFWRALAYVGFFINLINLIPVLPLDGGRALQALSPWVTFAGFVAFLGLTFFYFSPIMLLIVVFGGMETWRRFRSRKSPEAHAPDRPSRPAALRDRRRLHRLGSRYRRRHGAQLLRSPRELGLALPLGQRAVDLAPLLALLDVAAPVVAFLAAGQRDLDLGPRPAK